MILLTGLRASGKSLCGRALEDLLTDPDSDQCCKYLDLDERGENGPLKFKFFYEDCLQRMVDEGGTWILDKLSPYGDKERKKFLKTIQTTAERSILLQFVHDDELEELRICYFRLHRRGKNHHDLLSSDEDIFVNLKFEQKYRRVLEASEVDCLTHVKDVQINATPYEMLLQATNHLHEATFIDKTRIGFPLKLVLMEALQASLKKEQQIGKEDEELKLDAIMYDDLRRIRHQFAPQERGSPTRPWMQIVKKNDVYFLGKLGIEVAQASLFCDVVEPDVPVENLYELFCSTCEDTELLKHRSALEEWLSDERTATNDKWYPELERIAMEAFTKYCETLMQSTCSVLTEIGISHDVIYVQLERGHVEEFGIPSGWSHDVFDKEEIQKALSLSMMGM